MDTPSEPRMTLPTQLVLQALLADPTREMYGLEICHAVILPSGTVHPILARLEAVGWLESRWENIDPTTEGRPQRRYYRLTDSGRSAGSAALARARARHGVQGHLRPLGGMT